MPIGEFEQACADTERAAAAAAKAAVGLASAARQLVKAAQDGDIGKIRKASEGLKLSNLAAHAEAHNAAKSWPLNPDAEEALLRERYEAELMAAARSQGLKIQRQDDRLVSYPSLLKVLPENRAVQLDRTKVTALRPSRLVALLEKNQSKKPRFKPEQFLEALFEAYRLVAAEQSKGRGSSRRGAGTTLVRVYRALTLLPGTARDYDKTDFARDLHFLDRSGVSTTRSGFKVSFPASTGTRSAAQLFTFVAPDGAPVVYYGIRFAEVTS